MAPAQMLWNRRGRDDTFCCNLVSQTAECDGGGGGGVGGDRVHILLIQE